MLKTLAGSVRQYALLSILAPILVIGESLADVVIPQLMIGLIDNGINVGNMQVIWTTGIRLLILAVLATICGIAAAWASSKASAGFSCNLRQDLFYNLQNFSFRNIDRFSTASLITRLTTDVTNIQNAYMMILRITVKSPVMLIFAVIMSFRINGRLALIYLGAIPVLAVCLVFIIRYAHPRFRKVFTLYDRLNNVVQEDLRGIRVVKAFVREEHEREKFHDVSERIFRLFSKAEKAISLCIPIMQLCIFACLLLVSWFGAHLITSGVMTTGELIAITNYAFHILFSLLMLSVVFVMITISRASAERVCEVLDERSDITTHADPVTEVKDGSIRFENVDFSYAGDPDKLCLTHVDLEIAAGETVGILGGTGSSKSTLVQLIPRLYDVTNGTVYVGGVDVRDYDLNALRDQVAMVLQKNVLFSGTIRENLRWGDENASDEEMERVCRLAQADSFIREFPDGYDTYIEQGGSNVSGGQKQRLCIARALLKKPKILILDDSTSAVDTATDAQIRKAFLEEIPDTTKLIIAQRIASVQDADTIIVMDNGTVSAVGDHETLLATSDIYREVYESQVKGGDDT